MLGTWLTIMLIIPKLSPEWIVEDKTNVDRALAVTSEVANQFFGDFYIKNLCTRSYACI